MKPCWSVGMVLVGGALGCGDAGPQGSAIEEQPAEERVQSEVSPASTEPILSDSERRA